MRIAMQTLSNWDHFDTASKDDDEVIGQPKSPEDVVDQFGVRTALLVLCVAFFLAAMWVLSGPSFPKCSALGNVNERNACYSELRDELLKHPAKGP